MKSFRLLSLSLLLLIGCNDSPVPLGPASEAPMNEQFAGRWEYLPGQSDNELVSLRIIPFNEHEYYLEYRSQSNPEQLPEVLRLRAYTTLVEGVPFANIQLIGDEDTDYLIAKYDLSPGDTLSVRLVDEEMDHIQSSEELYQFVRGLLESGALDGDKDVGYFKKVEGGRRAVADAGS